MVICFSSIIKQVLLFSESTVQPLHISVFHRCWSLFYYFGQFFYFCANVALNILQGNPPPLNHFPPEGLGFSWAFILYKKLRISISKIISNNLRTIPYSQPPKSKLKEEGLPKLNIWMQPVLSLEVTVSLYSQMIDRDVGQSQTFSWKTLSNQFFPLISNRKQYKAA